MCSNGAGSSFEMELELEKIVKELESGSDELESPFYSIKTLKPEDFKVEVAEIGAIANLSDENLQKLIALSKQAKFGKGEQTVLDTKVRYTQEIDASKLKVTLNQQVFDTMLDEMRSELGLPDGTKLHANLYNMLVYTSGQFFKPHQDSEKLDNMVATLVISVPFAHIGGNLIIRHQCSEFSFNTEALSPTEIKCIAFYTDCEHEVKEVRQGFRVVLTYNLVLEDTRNGVSPDLCTPKFEQLLKTYFSKDKEGKNETLTFLLDHEYSEHGLKWSLLKGDDYKNAQIFKAAAQKLGLVPNLALVELEEAWSTDGDDREPYLEELIESMVSLNHVIDEQGKTFACGNYCIANDELCWSINTEEFKSSDEAHEGFTGNAGASSRYWYKRAALVLWPQADHIAMQFKMDQNAAIRSLVKLTSSSGNEERVYDIFSKGCEYLTFSHYRSEIDFATLSKILVYIHKPDLAYATLSKVGMIAINPNNIKAILSLQTTYGIDWCLNLVKHWRQVQHKVEIEEILNIIQNATSKIDNSVLNEVLEYQIDCLVSLDKNSWYSPRDLKKTQTERSKRAHHAIKACAMLKTDVVLKRLLDYIISQPDLYPATSLVEILLDSTWQKDKQQSYHLLWTYVMEGISKELDKGLREVGDWSIYAASRCKCEDCSTTKAFLVSKSESQKVWPLIAHKRDHVMQAYTELALPISFSVEKKGSPHRLIISKDEQLYQLSKTRFEQLQTYRKQLMDGASKELLNQG